MRVRSYDIAPRPARLSRTAICAVALLIPATASDRAAAQSSADTVELSEITVQGDGVPGGAGSNPESPLKVDGYVAKSATSGTKTETPIAETPQSISTVTGRQLEDRNVQTLTAAAAYTPGVRVNGAGFEPRFDTISIRGFGTNDQGIFRDGLREVNGPFFTFKTEPYGVDGVSILKGPASSLYGGGTPGGLIDITTKRPTFEPFGEIQTQLGNNDRRQGQFDVGGPAGGSGQFAYRVTGVVRESDTDVPGTPDDKVYITPAFVWKNDDAKLTVLSEYSRIRTGANLAYYNDYSTGRARVTGIYSGDPSYNAFRQEQARIGYELERKVSEGVTLRQKLRYAHVEGDAEYVDIDNIRPGATFSSRTAGAIAGRLDTLNVDNQIEAKGETGAVSHTLLAGVDAQYADITDKWGSANSRDNPNWVSRIRLDPLTYGGRIWSPNDNDVDNRQRQFNVGLYAQDQMKIGRMLATVGFRNDWVDTRTDDKLVGSVIKQSDGKFTGRAGLMFLGPLGLNPYVSYGTSFAPLLSTDASTRRLLVPTTGEQYEAGVKFAPPAINLVLTAAVFDITQKNVERTAPGGIGSIQTGEVNSKGFEFEATGGLAGGLSFTAGYAYLEPKIVRGEPGTGGGLLSAIPKHAASLWADYAFQPGSALAGLSLGGGARYTGRSWGDDENTFRNRAFLLFDASARFDVERVAPRLKGVALQVNARNLSNRTITTCEQGYCYRDEGRQVIASLRYRW